MSEVTEESRRRALAKRGFDLEEMLGRGAFGEVYRAKQRQFGRDVAVKFFAAAWLKNEANRKRFQRESLILSRVEHPGLPYVLTFGTVPEGDTPYMVMQYIQGPLLSQEMKGKYSVESSIRTISEVLGTLHVVHNAQVIHRDIKPDNIICGDYGAVVIDFSIGVSLKYEPGLTRATVEGHALGHADYVAPEQKQNAMDVDHRADIYSAGIVLFECVTGHPRVELARLGEQLRDHSRLAEIVRRACAADRMERYQSADEFRRDLARLISSPADLLSEKLAFCPTIGCSTSHLSNLGFFRGPKVVETTDTFCQACGARLVRGCPRCNSNIPPNLEELVVSRSKSEPDRRTAYCAGCGELLYRVPVCVKCGSFLKQGDIEAETATEGCTKCKQPQSSGWNENYIPSNSGEGDDIPF